MGQFSVTASQHAELSRILGEFSAIPYENLSKVVFFSRTGSPDPLRLHPPDGQSGGTCFLLTWHLRERLRRAGLETKFFLAHQSGRGASHCGQRPETDPGGWRISTGQPPDWRFRFRIRVQPATELEVLDAWQATYAFAMMRYPVKFTELAPRFGPDLVGLDCVEPEHT